MIGGIHEKLVLSVGNGHSSYVKSLQENLMNRFLSGRDKKSGFCFAMGSYECVRLLVWDILSQNLCKCAENIEFSVDSL